VEVEADESLQGKIRFADTVVGPVQLAVERQQQGHGMFGHGRRVSNRERALTVRAEFLRGAEVDIL